MFNNHVGSDDISAILLKFWRSGQADVFGRDCLESRLFRPLANLQLYKKLLRLPMKTQHYDVVTYFDDVAVDGHLDDAQRKVFSASVIAEAQIPRQSFKIRLLWQREMSLETNNGIAQQIRCHVLYERIWLFCRLAPRRRCGSS